MYMLMDSVPHPLTSFQWRPYHSIALLSEYRIILVWTRFVPLPQSLPGDQTPARLGLMPEICMFGRTPDLDLMYVNPELTPILICVQMPNHG